MTFGTRRGGRGNFVCLIAGRGFFGKMVLRPLGVFLDFHGKFGEVFSKLERAVNVVRLEFWRCRASLEFKRKSVNFM